MINWNSLAANALWIIGCALGLAALSYANWEAGMCGEGLRVRLRHPRMQITVNLAGALFCLGLAATLASTVETALWLFLSFLFFAQTWSVVLARQRHRGERPDGQD